MRIAVDFDGVLADLNSEWCRVYNELYNDTLDLTRIMTWDTHLYAKPECGLDFYALRTPEMYQNVKAIPHAIESVRQLAEEGVEPHIVTHDSDDFLEAKQDWLFRHGLGDLPIEVEKDKVESMKRHGLQLLIDDGPLNAVQVGGAGYPVFLFDNGGTYLYNQHHMYTYGRTVLRVSTWAELVELTQALMEYA